MSDNRCLALPYRYRGNLSRLGGQSRSPGRTTTRFFSELISTSGNFLFFFSPHFRNFLLGSPTATTPVSPGFSFFSYFCSYPPFLLFLEPDTYRFSHMANGA